jgi:hypothetical protein
MITTEKQLQEASKKAKTYLDNSNIDFLDLSQSNVEKVDEFLRNVYKDWKLSKIDDLTAYEIGSYLEAEPIHHLLETSIYPLCDLWFHVDRGDFDEIEKFKENVK